MVASAACMSNAAKVNRAQIKEVTSFIHTSLTSDGNRQLILRTIGNAPPQTNLHRLVYLSTVRA
eukprot:6199821-Pleurochrysis_carterae.AAC.4